MHPLSEVASLIGAESVVYLFESELHLLFLRHSDWVFRREIEKEIFVQRAVYEEVVYGIRERLQGIVVPPRADSERKGNLLVVVDIVGVSSVVLCDEHRRKFPFGERHILFDPPVEKRRNLFGIVQSVILQQTIRPTASCDDIQFRLDVVEELRAEDKNIVSSFIVFAATRLTTDIVAGMLELTADSVTLDGITLRVVGVVINFVHNQKV